MSHRPRIAPADFRPDPGAVDDHEDRDQPARRRQGPGQGGQRITLAGAKQQDADRNQHASGAGDNTKPGCSGNVAFDHETVGEPAGHRDRAADDDRPWQQRRQEPGDLDPVALPAAVGGERRRLAELGIVRDRRSHPSAVLRD